MSLMTHHHFASDDVRKLQRSPAIRSTPVPRGAGSSEQEQVALTIAHEINNVLMGMQALTELIVRRSADEEVRRHVDTLRRCIQRGKAVTDEILTGRGPRKKNMTVVGVRRWMEETLGDLEPMLPPNIKLELRIPDEDLFLLADQRRLSQVVVNLILNARDAMPGGGSLVISCEPCVSWDKMRFSVPSPDRYVHIKIRDTGTGIPPSALHRIFDPLYTTKAHGNGVGLALAKEIVQQHDGRIFAESTVGEGTVMHLFLLAASPEHDAGAPPASSHGAPRAGKRNAPEESQLVLLIDDDVMVTEALAAGLAREGRTIITCNDLEAAQLLVERLTPSHIVSDVHLSGPFNFEGLEFIRYAKRHSPESRVILMTGDAPDALQMEASERGATAFLQKPFDTGELDSLLNLVSCSELASGANAAPVVTMPSLDHILTSGDLQPLFQPIVALNHGYRHLGYEALARYRSNALLRNPEVLFDYALRKGRVADLEFAAVIGALQAGQQLAPAGLLFLNIHPAVLKRSRELREVLLREGRHFGLHRVVLEITEQESIPDEPATFEDIDCIRDAGVRFAFDDVGVAYSHLPFIDRIKPSFLKISQRFGTAFESDPAKSKIVTNLLTLARDFGCELILEGIEDASTAQAAAQLGIKYGQGFLFSRPADACVFAGTPTYSNDNIHHSV